MISSLLGYRYDEFTFSHILADKAQKNGDKTFLHFLPDGRKWSYAEVHEQSSRVANGFLAHGVGKGTHVAMLMDNSPEQLIVYFALGKIGAVVVPVNTAARGHFLSYYLNQSDSTALIVDQSLLEHALAMTDRDRIERIFVFDKEGDATLPEADRATLVDYRALEQGDPSAPEVEVAFSDLAAIMYTSGTTGPSKGNMFTQVHALTFAQGMGEAMGMGRGEVYHLVLPMFHAAAYNGGVLLMLLLDGTVALSDRLSVSSFWDEIRECKATRAMLLSVGGFLLAQPPSPRDRDHCLISAASAPMMANFAEFEERFGVRLTQAYGLTDYCVPLSQTTDTPAEKKLAMGRPVPGCEVRVVDDNDVDAPVGEPGEIVLRKDGLPFATSQGYYKMPEATVAAWRNMWFHTGDRAYRDADGYFYFVDRKKDAIRRRGENISTFEVETAIARHPSVADVAVYPVRADTREDDVGASVVFKRGLAISPEELIEHCRANMPYFMVPRYFDFRDTLPRTMTQKLRKVEMCEFVEANPGAVFDREKAGITITRNG